MKPSSTSFIERAGSGAALAHRFTMAELLIALSLLVVFAALVTRTVVMGWSQVKSGQSQLAYQQNARSGAEKISHDVQSGRSVVVTRGGTCLSVLNEDNTVRQFLYVDADGDAETVDDNRIWLDPDPEVEGDQRAVINRVTPLDGTPIFSALGTGVALAFRVGDPVGSTGADHESGSGYQGVVVRLVAKPRNIGHVWTLNNDL